MTDRATILGAGAMGTAFARPLVAAGYEVNLWGTRLDDEIVASLRTGNPHPRTGSTPPQGISLFDSTELDKALEGCDLLVLAIASQGVEAILLEVAARLRHDPAAMLILSKGFVLGPTGSVELMTEAAARILGASGRDLPLIGVGGPCKANEVAAGHETWAVFGGPDAEGVRALGRHISRTAFHAVPTTDVIGVEITAALKNVYAVAIGIADGLGEGTDQPYHDLAAAAFAEATRELALIVEAAGGRAATVAGLAGVGDLEVTGRSGRNKLLGERIARGEAVSEAVDAMARLGHTVEGWSSAAYVRAFLAEHRAPEPALSLPLLDTLVTVLTRSTAAPDIRHLVAEALALGLAEQPGTPVS